MELEGVFFNSTDYELQKKKLGEGAFGTVYVAKNLIDKQLYAAKLIHSPEGMSGHQQMLFLRESLTLNKLNHPSIVKFKGVNFQSLCPSTASNNNRISSPRLTKRQPGQRKEVDCRFGLDCDEKIYNVIRYCRCNALFARTRHYSPRPEARKHSC